MVQGEIIPAGSTAVNADGNLFARRGGRDIQLPLNDADSNNTAITSKVNKSMEMTEEELAELGTFDVTEKSRRKSGFCGVLFFLFVIFLLWYNCVREQPLSPHDVERLVINTAWEAKFNETLPPIAAEDLPRVAPTNSWFKITVQILLGVGIISPLIAGYKWGWKYPEWLEERMPQWMLDCLKGRSRDDTNDGGDSSRHDIEGAATFGTQDLQDPLELPSSSGSS